MDKYLILSSFISELDFIKGENLNVDGFMLKDAFAEDIVYAIKTIMRSSPGIVMMSDGVVLDKWSWRLYSN